jgi:hypothetical protein
MLNNAGWTELMIVSGTTLGYGCSINCTEGMVMIYECTY